MIYLQQNISFLRAYHRLTYDQLAEKVGCTSAMLKTYTGKNVTPPLDIICNIADFAHLTIDALVRHKLDAKSYLRLKGAVKINGKEADPIILIEKGLGLLKLKKK